MKLTTTTLALLAAIAFAAYDVQASIHLDSIGIIAIAGEGVANGSSYTPPAPTITVFDPLNPNDPIDADFLHAQTGTAIFSAASSHNSVSFSDSVTETIYSVSISHTASRFAARPEAVVIAGTLASQGFPVPGSSGIVFTVGNENVNYSIEGQYSFNGVAQFQASLVEVGSSDPEFSDNFESPTLDTGLWTLGDGVNAYGNLNGILQANTQYRWDFVAVLLAPDGADPFGTTAEGFLTLTLGDGNNPPDPGVVPEPVSMLTWCGLALTAYWGKTARRRRR